MVCSGSSYGSMSMIPGEIMEQRPGYFNMRLLKQWAREKLQRNSPLRKVILMENDFVEDRYFMGMVKVYFKLADL